MLFEVYAERGSGAKLLLQTEFLHKRTVHALVCSLEILQVFATISDEAQKAAA